MYNPNIFKNQDKNHHNPLPHHSGSFAITNLELYPRMRQTEFYCQPQIPDEYQSRSFEHPDILDSSEPMWIGQQRQKKIVPPKNSDMQIARNSYFS